MCNTEKRMEAWRVNFQDFLNKIVGVEDEQGPNIIENDIVIEPSTVGELKHGLNKQ